MHSKEKSLLKPVLILKGSLWSFTLFILSCQLAYPLWDDRCVAIKARVLGLISPFSYLKLAIPLILEREIQPVTPD